MLVDHHFDCIDCNLNTLLIGEYYMVQKYIWESSKADKAMLCITCLENRIGRILTPEDFPDLPVNTTTFYPKSTLALSRIIGLASGASMGTQ
jgi:hypothetical protein